MARPSMDIPADYLDAAEKAHTALVEAAAEGDEALMEKYFENGTLTAEEITERAAHHHPHPLLHPGLCRCRRAPKSASARCWMRSVP